MSLTTNVTEHMKEAMRSGDKLRLETLRSLRAAILEFQKSDANVQMTEEDEQRILSSAAKRRRDAAEQYRNAGREDLALREEAELKIINSYLPPELSNAELLTLTKDAIRSTQAIGLSDLGKVMGMVMKSVKGRADGNRIRELVTNLLKESS